MEKEWSGFWRKRDDLSSQFMGLCASRVLYDRPELRIKSSVAGMLFPFRDDLFRRSEKLTCLAMVPNPKLSFLEIYPYYRPRGKFETGGKEGVHHFEFDIFSRPGNLHKIHEALKECRGDLRTSHIWVTSDRYGTIGMAVDFAKVFDEQEEQRLYDEESGYKGDYYPEAVTKTVHGLFGYKIHRKLSDSVKKPVSQDFYFGYFKHGHDFSPKESHMHMQFTIGDSVRMHLKDLINGTYDRFWKTDCRFSEKLRCGYASFIYSFNLRNMTLETYLIGGDEFPCKFWFRMRDRPDAPYQVSRLIASLDVDILAATWAALPDENCAYFISYANIMNLPKVQPFAEQLREKVERRKAKTKHEKTRMLSEVHKIIRSVNTVVRKQIQMQIRNEERDDKDKIEMFNIEAIPEALREVRGKEVSSPVSVGKP